MKSKLAVIGSLFVACLGWAAPQEYTFVSTLSSPVASFKEIETKYTQVPTEFGNGTEVNLGSTRSGSGTVAVNGGAPVSIGQLVMEKNTTFAVGNSNKWIVDSLTIGTGGEVSPQSAHIQTLQVPSGSTLSVDQTLRMSGPVNISQAGSSVNSVEIGTGSSKFAFGSFSSGTGTFKPLTCSTQNQTAGLCSSGTINILEVK